MASGDTLASWTARAAQPPDDVAFTTAPFHSRKNHIVCDFADDATETVFFSTIMPQLYRGNGVNVLIYYAMSNASGAATDVVWGAAFEALPVSTALGTDSFATEKTTVSTIPNASGEVKTAIITFSDGAQMDSVAVGNLFRLKISRLGGDGDDDAAGDAELLGVAIKEN